jgi:hypothetical protein
MFWACGSLVPRRKNMVEGAGAPTKRRGRSPAYPGVNLETAILRVRQLYERERQHATPVETIAQHWGYKSINGPGAVTLSALKKFGLLTDDGSGADRRARLTDLAIEIIENPSVEARNAAKREAALSPTIHRELWEKYGPSLPSDPNLRWELTRERGFTETGADEFIPEYRETIQFAELTEADLSTAQQHRPTTDEPLQREEQDVPALVSSPAEMPAPNTDAERFESRATTTYAIPLPKNAGMVQLTAKFPLTEAEWQYFIKLLEALKAGLVDDRS